MKYNIGDKVVITGNADNDHYFDIGAECKVVVGPYHYENEGICCDLQRGSLVQTVLVSDFRLAEQPTTAYPSIQAYRDRVTSMDEGDE